MSPSQSPHEIAVEAIDLFLQFRAVCGDETIARSQAIGQFIDAEPGAQKDEAIKKAI